MSVCIVFIVDGGVHSCNLLLGTELHERLIIIQPFKKFHVVELTFIIISIEMDCLILLS